MDITLTVTFSDEETNTLSKVLARAKLRDPDLTARTLLDRLIHKSVNEWVREERALFIQANSAVLIEALFSVITTGTQEERDAKLAVLGLQYVNGQIQKIP